MTTGRVILLIAIMSVITAAIRFTPFVLFAGKKTPPWLSYLGRVLPPAVIAMLVVYCLKGVSFRSVEGFMPTLIAGAAVVGTYIWKKNTLISVLIGTVGYMLLVQFVFV